MINITSVNDYKGDLNDLNFDLGIFASGYENRSVNIIKNINQKLIKNIFVFGFDNFAQSSRRKSNDEFYKSINHNIIIINNDDEIYNLLNTKLSKSNENNFKVLIDYSSMPRNWYNAIISWFKFQNLFLKVEIYFTYSAGTYEMEYHPFIIQDIVPLPGLEGSDIFNEQSIALFGIGFDGDAAISVYDTLEPDVIHIFAADNDSYEDKAIKVNNELILNTSNKIEKIPLNSVETAFRSIGEMVSSYINNSHISIIPMGPKTLTLASILISHRFNQITCLRVVGSRNKAHEDIEATGEIVVTKIIYE